MRKLWRWLCGVGAYLFFWCRLYKLNSAVHRALFDGKYSQVLVPRFDKLSQHVDYMRNFKWKKDEVTELFDAVCTPNKVVSAISSGSSPHGNDCDEAAILGVSVVNSSLASGLMKDDGIKAAYFMTVTWLTDWSPGGHNVCLLEHPVANGTYWSYMDYGSPSERRHSIEEVVADVHVRYAPKAEPLVWCVADGSLSPKKVRWT